MTKKSDYDSTIKYCLRQLELYAEKSDSQNGYVIYSASGREIGTLSPPFESNSSKAVNLILEYEKFSQEFRLAKRSLEFKLKGFRITLQLP